jgi:hypothetical protein
LVRWARRACTRDFFFLPWLLLFSRFAPIRPVSWAAGRVSTSKHYVFYQKYLKGFDGKKVLLLYIKIIAELFFLNCCFFLTKILYFELLKS